MLLPIPRSVGIFAADSWWYAMRALKKTTFKMAPTGNEVDRIVLICCGSSCLTRPKRVPKHRIYVLYLYAE